jgi:hypothetical protein
MAKFLTGNELNSELEKIFERADEQLILISPYIKLHDRLISTLRTKRDNHKLEIIIVFGKNEEDISKSMKQEDFNFFKEFPNIQIRYEKRLHAKYFANESAAILTSMNLHSYSLDNNIEAGVMTKATLLGNLTSNFMTNVTGEDSFDVQAWNYFERVIDQAELLFHKIPVYENTMFGLTKKYTDSKVEVDKLSDFFSNRAKYESPNRNKDNYERKKAEPSVAKQDVQSGYCIRTGKQIPFNPSRPFSDEAFQSWSKFSKDDYPEKYCHFSGEQSNGETTKAKPILRKNWKEAKRIFNL